MLTDPYIEALLVDEELADMVWELWDRGVISDEIANLAWNTINWQSKSSASSCPVRVPACQKDA